jgi:hypothetical protein
MKETELQASVEKLADRYHVLYTHTPDSRRVHGLRGYPDITLCGLVVVFAELKGDGGTLSPGQVTWKYRLMATGAVWYGWWPADLANGEIERVMRILAPYPSKTSEEGIAA